ncbi:hypothetical protein ACIBCT_30390 [Streptosporangium sp. NPDC050855]|uniref:hypothetical protein n=1 Tax=Streptosporangium sp. NPDC050855 TaxID=3366194 RepID=UPI003790303E
MTIVLDPHDDRAVTDAALAAHAPEHGCITVHPTTAVTDDQILAHDVLIALGKRATQLNVQHLSNAASAWAAAATWTRIGGVTTVIVLRAHRMTPRRWQRLLHLRALTGVHLMLIHHHGDIAPALQQQLAEIEHHISCDPHLLPERPITKAPIDADEPATPLPEVVAAPLPWYRANAYRCLSATAFARLDTEYRRGLHNACRWLSAHDEHASHKTALALNNIGISFEASKASTLVDHLLGRTPMVEATSSLADVSDRSVRPWSDSVGLQVFLSGLVSDAPTPGHSIARIRGAQAAFLLHGLLLSPPEDLSTAHGPGFGRSSFTRSAAHRIRSQIAHPLIATALATALLTGEPSHEVAQMALQTVDDDARRLRRGNYRYAIPDHGRDLLQAGALFRRMSSARIGKRFATLIGRDGALLEPAARACDVELHLDAPLERPWHYLTGCWHIGPALHQRHLDADRQPASPHQERP